GNITAKTYPRLLKFAESKILDFLFLVSCIVSIILYLTSIGLLTKNKFFFALIHAFNTIYFAGLAAKWLQVIITSKFSKPNRGFTKQDVCIGFLTVMPLDLIVISYYCLNRMDFVTNWDFALLSAARANYLLRAYFILQYFY